MSDRRSAREARFRKHVAAWAARLKVEPVQVRLQPMTRKWASCSIQGRVTFSHDLLGQPRGFQDYVIVHELLHLRIPNHGRLFKSLMKAHLTEGRLQYAAEEVGLSGPCEIAECKV